ncbi:hypothetical protein ISO79_01980 [Morganella morganii subsp. morganii]|uniref:hypothetical protein n=1 Tax=Morganella morganii TaxID=582 RepID=UPI001BDB228E|nr:hypothetical protein [Morganella morganii subsp. morganii]HDU8625380.1 hypothetical protein [Morganella morganii]
MKRKFIHEFAFGYLNSFTAMVTAQQLTSDARISLAQEEQLSKCHIYFICARPSFYFINNTIKHEENILSGEIGYKIDGKESKFHFEYDWILEGDAIDVICNYPFREVISINNEGEEITYISASIIATIYSSKLGCYSDMSSYEVLYIGQAVGKNGSRNAVERLRNHSKLQKILAQTLYNKPDQEIMIFMYAFEHEQVFSSLDGGAGLIDDTDSDDKRFKSALKNRPNKNQAINMIEAALIRYFQPEYNEKFKESKISPKLKSLEKCYDLDMSGIVVEINTENLFYSLYSKSIKKNYHHIVKIDLVSHQQRLSFFRPTGFDALPGIIE